MCSFFFFKQKTAYEMRISDWSSDVCSSDLEITLLGAVNILTGCYDSDNFANEPFCGLFMRTAGGPDAQSVASVTDRYVNISRQRNRGVDLSLAIDQDLGHLGALTFRAQMKIGRASRRERVWQYV